MTVFHNRYPVTILLLTLSSYALANQSPADSDRSCSAPSLHARAIELGLSGSFTVVEDLSHAAVTVQTGTFMQTPVGLAGAGLELSYSHLRSLDWLDFQGSFSWQRAWGRTSVYPYVSLSGGLRQEWLGSFRQARYPVGLNLGLRTLIGQESALRTEYRFRRIFHDPVSNFSEHQLVLGISLLLRND